MNRRLPFLVLSVLALLVLSLALLSLSDRSLAAADPICVKTGGASDCCAILREC